MKLKQGKFIVILIPIIILYTFFRLDNDFLPIEQLSIPSIIGIDLENPNSLGKTYKSTTAIYNFNDNIPNKDIIIQSYVNTLGQNRELNEVQLPSKFLPGAEKVLLLGTNLSKDSIKNIIDLFFITKTSVDNTVLAVSNDVETIVKFKIEGYRNSGDYIEGMINTLSAFNFFNTTYTIMDAYSKVDSIGKNIALPFIEIQDNRIKVTGMALFNKYKMIDVINIQDTKFLNLLRENNVSGNLSIKKYQNFYIDYYAKSKKKVKCTKEGNQFKFDIYINLNGELVSNELFNNISHEPEVMKKFETDMAIQLEKQCSDFIKKIQKKYDADVLELGKYAAAKYGRYPSMDWNKIVPKSKIESHIKVKITDFGRGDF